MSQENKPTKPEINWDLLLTTVFYIFAGASLITFFACRAEMPRLFLILGCVAILLRVIYYIRKFVALR